MSGTDMREQGLGDAVSLDHLTRYNAEIAKGVRLSGSADEAAAFAYLAAQCRSYGMVVEQYAIDAYVSLPGAATLVVVTPEARDIACITHSFSLATGPEGLTAPLVAVGNGTTAADYADKEVRGAVVLVDGLAMPAAAHAAYQAGAAAMICVNPAGLHEMIISPVWGTPTPETAAALPQLVAVSVRKQEGDALKALLVQGPVTVRLQTEVETGWRPIPTLTAEIRGAEDRFVLLSGHVDSWHYGAMDNASANATMLEIGRLL
ncbi:MAG: M28 family metallopeptidase, partial [Thermomicrobia bacterium]|nr:M28 family metallopeptidase [Thermomicrobia bacterium]